MVLIVTLLLALLFVPWPGNLFVIGAAGLYEVATALFGIAYSKRRSAQVGVETLVGTLAEAITPLAPSGQVKVAGEIWTAHSAEGARAGDKVRVKRVDGLRLEVEPASRMATLSPHAPG